ncbi:hypothetical protein L6164_017946 [Bauhinia variegata]|uniref:Uncharacterized protein n=1 Tax=Bauhinia variegata TaxID=167791 RepID=A0ACB9N9Q8_BAUVA|nr:hypothetical protein L6164_017946 [Bauhinia variegata]
MENSNAILSRISSLKDMLDQLIVHLISSENQVNQEIEANIQIMQEIESKIVKCSEIDSELATRQAWLMKTSFMLQVEIV